MTASPEVLILDVGHGNCSIIRSDDSVCVVDAPTGTTLLETLRRLSITSIDTIILSHADKDHVAGVSALLTCQDIAVKILYLNSDATKKGPRSPWQKLRTSIAVARQQAALKVVTSLTSDFLCPITVGSATLEVLAPSPELIMGGAGSTDVEGKTLLTSNSVSAVVRVTYDGVGVFLLPGDLDGIGLTSMIAEGKDATAKVLLFPHHGGLPGKTLTAEEFTRRLCKHVQPELIIFSNSREHFTNPRPEIIATIRGATSANIACTQLSKKCLASTDGINAVHLHDIPAFGKTNKSCCAGSVRFLLNELVANNSTCLAPHKEFVSVHISSSLCKS